MNEQQTDKQNFYFKLMRYFLMPQILILILKCLLNILGSSLQALTSTSLGLFYFLGFYSNPYLGINLNSWDFTLNIETFF